jgi:thiamine-phosphate pyrophosphorylase
LEEGYLCSENNQVPKVFVFGPEGNIRGAGSEEAAPYSFAPATLRLLTIPSILHEIFCQLSRSALILGGMEKSAYRIIDANFNRGREATRVMEEYCRFVLNSADLSAQCKNLRHRLSAAIARLDAEKLITSRDCQRDVGACLQVPDQMARGDLKDCFTAAAKRLPEALRALAETAQTINGFNGQVFEQLRFDCYTLEKLVVTFSSAMERYSGVQLYVIVTVKHISQIPNALKLATDCAAGGADCIQLRCKGIGDSELFKLACEMVKVCHDNDAICIINDRPDIAIASDADGVHLGQDDLPVDQVRRLQTEPMIIGLSTHNTDQLKEAIAQCVTYVGLGPVYATDTKPGLKPAGLQYAGSAIEMLSQTGIGHAAIGGINMENIDAVLKAGIGTVALCSPLANSDNPKALCSSLKSKIISS